MVSKRSRATHYPHGSAENVDLEWRLSLVRRERQRLYRAGKLADLAVLTKNYAICSEDEIKDIEALRTVVNGKIVYDRLQ